MTRVIDHGLTPYFYFYIVFRPPPSFRFFLSLFFLFLLMMSVLRLLFFLFNTEFFAGVNALHFLAGIRFDVIACCYGLIPAFILLILNPFSGRKSVIFSRFFSYVAAVLFSLVSCIDIIYYRFTLKRMTWDIFRYVSTGTDTTSLIPTFMADYWYMLLIWLVISTFFILAIKRMSFPLDGPARSLWYRILFISIAALALIIGMRGGFQLKPLNIMDASAFAQGPEVSLVLNTPFTLMKTAGKEGLEQRKYFKNEEEAYVYFNPHFTIQADSNPKKQNVVILIMESLAREYIGFFNGGKGFTPFLDSLMMKSIVIENTYANGRRSIEALPAIFSGIPNLMNEAFTTSAYAGNEIESLPAILKKKGYASAFFHGGKNGTMGFKAFTSKIGFDHYYGMDEYPEKGDFDGSWGIYDLPYFQYVSGKQHDMKQPFLTAVFSLSAHHPYVLPEGYDELCKGGSLPIHRMINYSDLALKAYFNSASKAEWYDNSIFIITADHTAQSIIDAYASPTAIYEIPLIIFEPGKSEGRLLKKAAQQSDIAPTIIDLLDINSENIFFGKSTLDSIDKGFAVNYLSGIYQITDGETCVRFNGEEMVSVSDASGKPLANGEDERKKTEALLMKLKAVIQQYNRRMADNDLVIHD